VAGALLGLHLAGCTAVEANRPKVQTEAPVASAEPQDAAPHNSAEPPQGGIRCSSIPFDGTPMGRIIEQEDSSSQEADLRLRVRELPELAVGQQYVLLDGHVVVGMATVLGPGCGLDHDKCYGDCAWLNACGALSPTPGANTTKAPERSDMIELWRVAIGPVDGLAGKITVRFFDAEDRPDGWRLQLVADTDGDGQDDLEQLEADCGRDDTAVETRVLRAGSWHVTERVIVPLAY